MSLQPLGARILVKRLPPPEQTRGGIYLLGREYPTLGRIEAIGDGKKTFGTGRQLVSTFHTGRVHLPEVVWGHLRIDDFINFHRDAIRQELTLDNDYIMLSREHCLASYGANMQNFRPLGDRVLIKPLDEVKQIGSIHVPDQAVERPVYGRVIAVGEGRFLGNGQYLPCDVQVGDKVLFGKFMGSEIKLDGEEHLLVREDDIMGIEHD
jgi:chaperonin GroES